MLKSNRIIKSRRFDKVERVVIAFHGYGDDGDNFSEAGSLFLAPKLDNAIFLFPNAPHDCDIGFGRQWFALDEMSYNELRCGLEEVTPIVREYIENVSQEYNCKNINLIGFSQGAMIVFEMLYYPGISKIVAYSGVFAAPRDKKPLSNAEVLIMHSEDDDVVPYKNAERAKKNLENLGVKVSLKTCNGIGHSISAEGLDYGVEFLKSF
ncbi:MAG: dienelactone hydrolase family protein [Holosporales bacterium]|jgi:phospholipase/carboxylesterase|nr:dienelactone hydrolase family protein [Holosporales bacterium]